MTSCISTNQSNAEERPSTQLCHEICPFVAQPFSDCYCFSITSSKVPMALYFCGGNYQECSIYQQHLKKQETDK